MGSADFYPEERPVHPVVVDEFWIDRHPVTVAQFRRFARATGYVTLAERAPQADQYPGVDPALLVPGSLVFRPTTGPVPLDDVRAWWHWTPGAHWRHPEGPGSGVSGRARHPVTHIAFEDAAAYATWSGKQLPSEAQWEYAARGGLAGAVYCWGDEFTPGGQLMANTWHGEFPWQNLRPHRHQRTSPVGSFPANGYGLADMAGNVWEWTADYYTPRHQASGGCCAPRDPRVPEPVLAEAVPRRVIKGGSHLCAPNYCLRYRPAARQGQAMDSSTSHLGFRCAHTVDRYPHPLT